MYSILNLFLFGNPSLFIFWMFYLKFVIEHETVLMYASFFFSVHLTWGKWVVGCIAIFCLNRSCNLQGRDFLSTCRPEPNMSKALNKIRTFDSYQRCYPNHPWSWIRGRVWVHRHHLTSCILPPRKLDCKISLRSVI